MPWGCRTYIDGVVNFDSTATSIGRYVGTYNIGSTNGSMTIPELAMGVPDCQVYPVGSGVAQSPEVSFSGTTMSWVFPTGSGASYPTANCYATVYVTS